MVNEHINEELERFQKAPGRAFYALQIDAPWGTGKTHFIQSFLDRKRSIASAQDRLDHTPGSLSVSLFESRSTADLDRQLTTQFRLDDLGPVGGLASTLLDSAGGYLGISDVVREKKAFAATGKLANALERFRNRNGLLIFDDVERTRMPMRDALGYMNRFVEHEGFKVVLVTSEASLRRPTASAEDRRNLRDLLAFKEKLVGRTLVLTPEPEKAYGAFVASMAHLEARRLAEQHRDVAVQLFRASSHGNLRSMRVGLEAFDRLVSTFVPAWIEQAEAMREILLGCLYVAIELDRPRLSSPW